MDSVDVSGAANRYRDFLDSDESASTVFDATFPLDRDLAERLDSILFPPGSLSEKYPPPDPAGEFPVDDGTAGSVTPSDIAIDGAGYVYISDLKRGRVRQFDSEGRFQKDFGGEEALDGPAGIAVAGQNHLLVADAAAGRVFQFDSRGRISATFGDPARLQTPTHLLRMMDGRVFVVDSATRKVLRFSPGGEFELEWGGSGEGDGQFQGISGIAAGPDGNVYVADYGNARIQKFTPNGAHLLDIGGAARLASPLLLAPHASQSVHVLDTLWNGDVLNIKIFGADGLQIGRLSKPDAITRAGGFTQSVSGSVYLADTRAHVLVRLHAGGDPDPNWNESVAASDLVLSPAALAVDADDTLYAAVRRTASIYSSEHRILRIASNGGVELFSADAMLAARATDLVDLAVLPDGGVCVALRSRSMNDGYRGVQRYDSAGRYLGDLMRHYPFDLPTDLAVDASDRIYVYESGISRPSAFTGDFRANGDFASVWNQSADLRPQLRHVAFDSLGNMYLYRQRRIHKYDAGGTAVAGYAADFFQDYQQRYQDGTSEFDAITVDDAGNLYAVRRSLSRIIKFDANGYVDVAWTDAVNDAGGSPRFNLPDRCVTDGTQRLYVLERNSGRIHVLQLNDGAGGLVDLQGALAANHQAFHIAASAAALVVVARGGGSSAAYRFAADGTYDPVWSDAARNALGPYADLYGAAFRAGGHLLVMDLRRATAYQLSDTGEIEFGFGAMAFFSRPERLNVDDAGRLLVFDSGTRRIYRFAADFAGEAEVLPQFPETVLENARDLRVLGNTVYMIDSRQPGIQVYDLASGERRPDLAGENPFHLPGGLDFDPAGDLVVSDFKGGQQADSGLHYIRLNSTGQVLSRGRGPSEITNSQYSFHMGSDGSLYWSWMLNGKFYRIGPDGNTDEAWEERTTAAAGLTSAGEFLPLPDGRFAISDRSDHRVRLLDAAGTVERDIEGGSPYREPRSIAADENGNLFVLDHATGTLFKIAPDGTILWENGGIPLETITALAFREGRGLFLLTSSGLQQQETSIFRIDTNAGGHGLWWSETDEDSPIFYTPRDIAIAPDGCVYVGEGYGNRVTKFTPDAAVEWRKNHKQGARQFLSPDSIAIDGEGYLYVVEDRRGTVSILDRDALFYTDWGDSGAAESRIGGHPQVAVNSVGAVYVLERFNFRVRRYTAWPSRPIRNESTWATVVDLRGARWASQFNRLRAEYDFAKDRFDEVETLHAERTTSGFAPAAELLELEDMFQNAFRELLQAEAPLVEFKTYLASRGVGVGVSHDEIAAELEAAARSDEERLRNLYAAIPEDADLREFNYRDGEFRDQYGLLLQDSVRNPTPDRNPNTLFLIPLESAANGELTRVFLVRNAAYSGRRIKPPTVSFEESYKLSLGWHGASPGEFSHSISLLPGEERDLELITSRKRSFQAESTAAKDSRSSTKFDRTVKNKRNDDFQSNVSSQFKSDQRFNRTKTRSHTSTSTSGGGGAFGFSAGPFSFGGGIDTSTTRENSMSASSSYSTDRMRNTVATIVRNTAGEVSRNNRVSFRESTDIKTEFETRVNEEDLDHELQKLRVKNINEGRTVNYAFFQVANNYASELHLESVRVHISTGIEIIPNSGVVAEKSFNLTDFGRLLNEIEMLDEGERRELSAVVAQHILRRYFRLPDESPSGARLISVDPASLSGSGLSAARLRTLRNDAHAPPGPGDDRYELFEGRLLAFAGLKFTSETVSLGLQERYSVNSGKYFVDAKVGRVPATEAYLEERRTIEAERQRAAVEDLRARTAAGVFVHELPEGIEELSVTDADAGEKV